MNVEKARASLDAAAQLQTSDGIASSQWTEISALLLIAQTQALVALAEALTTIATKYAPPARDKFDNAPGAYL